MRFLCVLLAACLNLNAAVLAMPSGCPEANPYVVRRLGRLISPAELRGDLSFLSSDVLAGRFSPSPGLAIAGEFIASRFRAAGLEPGGDNNQFLQTATISDGNARVPKKGDSPSQQAANVIGILSGSDSILRNTYVLLTAHYDHIGTTKTAGREAADHPAPDDPDQVYNGANDDGSGTVSVTAVARALANLPTRPKRSIMFILFFGEELGLRGSEFYTRHPTVPLSRIAVELNLEQIGRTDSTEGPKLATASLTGMDYSDVTGIVQCAGAKTGISISRDKGTDEYFVRSDNASFAQLGIPSHTLVVAFDFPDYHRVGDEWQKVDYKNMAKVDRMVALAVLNIANRKMAPQWNAANSKSKPFREAQKKLLAH